MSTPFVLTARSVLLVASALLAVASDKTPGNYNIPLWEPGKVPLAKGDGPLNKPFLTVFMPEPGKANGASVVIAPGGSNIMLMYGDEGINIAERYNEWGVAAFVLTYRLSPRYGEDARVLDGRRAIEIVRSRASEFKIDPKKVGFIGFSAGSSLARSVAAASGSDPATRPDYLGMVYSAGRATPGEDLKSFPPTFILSAAWDRGAAIGSAQLLVEMLKAGTIAELHIYQKGRHGFGSGFASGTYSDWMGRLQHFLKQGGFLPGGRE